MLRIWLVGAAIACVLTSVVLAKQGIIKTKQGQTIEGDVTEKAESVVVNVRGIQTEIRRSDIISIEYPESIDKEYAKRLAALDPKDAQGHIVLARWAFDNRAYDEAMDAVDRALQIDPNNSEAMTFRDLIRNQRQMERQNENRPPVDNRPPPTRPGEGQAPRNEGGEDRRFLSNTDINRIRQKELTRDDSRMSFKFQNNVLKRFADAYNMPDSFFRSTNAYDQAQEILKSNDLKFTDDVIVSKDPVSLLEFKQKIQPLVLSGCATSGCHGGGSNAGGFMVYSDAAGNEAATYTNFYILQKTSKVAVDPRSTFGSGPSSRYMIDRTQPQNSLLAQLALPREVADIKHPTAGTYNGVFRNRSDARYKNLIEWMGSRLVAVEPEYQITYTLPGATTQPATQSTGQ